MATAHRPEDFGIGRLFWVMREAAIVADVDTGCIVLWNPAAEALLGYPAAEAHGLDLAALVPERLRAAHRAGLARYRATGQGRLVDSGAPAELAAVRRDGAEVPIELTLTPLPGPGGGRYALALLRDLSARRRAEAAAREGAEAFATLFEAAGEGIAIHEGGRHVAVNAALAALLGYAPAELVGRQAWEVVAPASREAVRRHALAGYAHPYEAVGLRKDGGTFPCEILGKPIRYRGRPARLVTVRDTSARARREAERAAQARLDGALLAVRTAEHELLNQLAGASGALQLLLRQPGLPPRAAAYARQALGRTQDVAATVDRLQHLVGLAETAWGPWLPPTIDLRESGE